MEIDKIGGDRSGYWLYWAGDEEFLGIVSMKKSANVCDGCTIAVIGDDCLVGGCVCIKAMKNEFGVDACSMVWEEGWQCCR